MGGNIKGKAHTGSHNQRKYFCISFHHNLLQSELSVLLIPDFKSEGECMIFLIKLLGILLGFAFPVFTIKAIKESLQGKSREQVYVVLSSVCGGAIMLIVMGLLPNT